MSNGRISEQTRREIEDDLIMGAKSRDVATYHDVSLRSVQYIKAEMTRKNKPILNTPFYKQLVGRIRYYAEKTIKSCRERQNGRA